MLSPARFLVTFLVRAFRRRRGGLVRSIVEVAFVGGLVFFLSGYARGAAPDVTLARAIEWLQNATRNALADEWVKPVIADGVVLFLTSIGCSILLLAMAALLTRIPTFMGFLILSDFHRRQGHSLSAVELLLGISLPIALTLALVSNTLLSVYAAVHVVLAYAYIRFSNDPKRVDSVLNWFVRIRTAADNPMEGGDDDLDES